MSENVMPGAVIVGIVALVFGGMLFSPYRYAGKEGASPPPVKGEGLEQVASTWGNIKLRRYLLPDGSHLALWGDDGIAFVPSSTGWK